VEENRALQRAHGGGAVTDETPTPGPRAERRLSLVAELQRHRKENRLVVFLALAVLVVWSASSVLRQRAEEMEPATITRGLLLFVLSYLNVTLIAAVLFVLCRTLIKVWLERRRGILGSRFKTRLLVTYIGLTAIPIGLLFFTATGFLQRSIDRWFSSPVREVVGRARSVEDMAERRIADGAMEDARSLARLPMERVSAAEILRELEDFRLKERLESVEVYRGGKREGAVADFGDVAPLPAESVQAALSHGEALKVEVLPDGAHLYRAAVRSGDRVVAVGVRVRPADARAMRAIASAWSDYQKLEVQKPSIKAANVSTFLLITLAVLLASIWTGMTLARRITGPIAALAESTRRIRSGDLSSRVEVAANDELGVLVDSFNSMAAGLQEARDATLRSNEELQEINRRLDLERRLLSTVLGSVTTGVLAFDAAGRATVANPAARALLSLGDGDVTLDRLRGRAELAPLVSLLEEAGSGTVQSGTRELILSGEGGERRLEIALRPLSGDPGGDGGGSVVAVEDTTHVAREQKLAAWSEVARRVAHEIKNPLTPIRLSAERIVRRLRAGEPDLSETIERGTRVIVDEVGVLKSLVDEFSRFARLPEMKPEPVDLAGLAASAVRLFEGVRDGIVVRVDSRLSRERVQLDPEQIKRVLINLIDNALEACGPAGEIVVRLSDGLRGVTIEVADTGRGIPPRDREKLFLPDFTTKGRGTGLGLAIVSRIVADHNGTIRVEDNRPKGARFIIELPAA
jgi:two-component system, NtrC family, nitrogen regulation sensor histidine kinase NtrY